MKRSPRDRIPPELYRFLGLGGETAAATVVLALGGWWIDQKYGSAPWGLVVGALMGIVGGLYVMIKTALSQWK